MCRDETRHSPPTTDRDERRRRPRRPVSDSRRPTSDSSAMSFTGRRWPTTTDSRCTLVRPGARRDDAVRSGPTRPPAEDNLYLLAFRVASVYRSKNVRRNGEGGGQKLPTVKQQKSTTQ